MKNTIREDSNLTPTGLEPWTPELITWDAAGRAFFKESGIGHIFYKEKDDPNSIAGTPLPAVKVYGGQCGGIQSGAVYTDAEDAKRWVEWNYYRVKERLRCIDECYSRISEMDDCSRAINNLSGLHYNVTLLEQPEYKLVTSVAAG